MSPEVDMDPTEAAEFAQSTAEEAGEAAAEAAGGEEAAIDPLQMLLHTEPDMDTAKAAGTVGDDPRLQHGYIGLRKCLDYLLNASGVDIGSGTPAVVNFGLAAMHTVTGGRGGGGDEDTPEGGVVP